ncbi:YkuJ family protein [Lacticigenium naphthae]|uniref:YkuJ family protein n=1 Tax=Lacticigenium naphthae TaxID=515351 RepID=UPI000404A410|nr:YkuJ family protein [Lacticigenium naphthae]
MKSSQLIPIIRRLEAMQEDKGEEIQIRRFESDGSERCIVKYDKKTGTFELEERSSGQTYQFDNIDYVAIEVLELVQPVENSK